MSGVEFVDTTVKTIESVLEQQTNSMPDLWEEVWRAQRGPAQNRIDLKACNVTGKFYDREFLDGVMYRNCNIGEDLLVLYPHLEQLVCYNMVRALHLLGWVPPGPGSTFSESQLSKQLRIASQHRKYFGYILQVLGDERILEQDQELGSWRVLRYPPSLEECQELLSSHAYTSELIREFNVAKLFITFGEKLSEILTGKQNPLFILFPEVSSWENPGVSEFYEEYGGKFGIEEHITLITERYLKHIKKQDPTDKAVLRILEVGAGTGAMTESYLTLLVAESLQFEYTYTDISPAFLSRAAKRFEKWGKAIIFRKLNIEEDPIAQGFTPCYFDIVCCTDVIHATRDIQESIKNISLLMKPSGSFQMEEMTKKVRLIAFLIGSLDGFWRFTDHDLRSDYCCISGEKWKQALESSGFESATCFPTFQSRHSWIYTVRSDTMEATLGPNQPKNKFWLLFHHPESSISNFLLKQFPILSTRQVLAVRQSEYFSRMGNEFCVNAANECDFNTLMETFNEKCYLEGIVYCWALNPKTTSQDEILRPYFFLCKSLSRLKQKSFPRVLVLTTSASGFTIGEMDDYTNPGNGVYSSTLWGLSKAIQNENTELSIRCVDLGRDESCDSEDFRIQIFYEIWSGEKPENQVAYSGSTRYVAKMQFHKPHLAGLKLPPGTDRFKIILPETRNIQDLAFGTLDPETLGETEVEVQVMACALNFRDVLNVIKPSEEFEKEEAIGFHLSGIVKRVGKKVVNWKVGDPAMCVNMKGAAFPSHIILNEGDLAHFDLSQISFCEAATLPVVVLTAYKCLVQVAKMGHQDTVLIHTASGGVGLSAIQLCKHLDIQNIICTAGSARKRNYLKNILGIRNVFHSRNTDYSKQILEVTNGRGVDVVLNSLTGDGFKESTLAACAHGARFVEMSRLNIWTEEEVRNLRPDVDYTIVDLSKLDRAEWVRLMYNLKELTGSGVVTPIPYMRFDAAHIRQALYLLQKTKHIGKVVCVMPELRQEKNPRVLDTRIFNDTSTYLITGGLGGIGFTLCEWMLGKGARHIILAGRSPPTPALHQNISQLVSETGSNITAVELDVGNMPEVMELVQVKLRKMGYPSLKGVMHCAGTLKDGLVENHNWPEFSSTFNTKVTGTINLHEVTKRLNLEHFVLFSSMASMLGSPGQANHSAGNCFEDAFAHFRHSLGLPATSINWGQWGQVGVATEIDFPGLNPLSNLQGLAALEYALKSQAIQLGALNVESFVLCSKLMPSVKTYLDERSWKMKGGTATVAGSGIAIKSKLFWQQYDGCPGKLEKLELLQQTMTLLLKHILQLDEADEMSPEQEFQDMGVDSLMFVEIKNAVQALLRDRVTVSASNLKHCNNINKLSTTLISLIEGNVEESEEEPSAEKVAELIREDCQLPEEIRAQEGLEPVPLRGIKTVLLTGTTGNLGPYLLRELANQPQISKVVCLMRPNPQRTPEERLRQVLAERDILHEVEMGKVTIVTGNVAKPRLGLEKPVWSQLIDEVDAVFNAAAMVSHTEYYRKSESASSSRHVNVQGLKNTLEFCCSGKKLKWALHTGTILSVNVMDGNGHMSEGWPEVGDYDLIHTAAYPNTKFVQDLLMKGAVLQRGIPGNVFRLPLIIGDSRTGNFVLNGNHQMLRYLFIMKMGLMPSHPLPITMLPVDICARLTIQLFFDERCGNEIVNVLLSKPELDQEFVPIGERLGYPVEIVELSEFRKKVLESTSGDSPFAIFKELYARDEDELVTAYTMSPVLRKCLEATEEDRLKLFSSPKLVRLAPEFYTGLEPGMEWIYRELLFAKSKGWLEKYGL